MKTSSRPGAEEALRLAQEAAGELGHGYVGTEHLLLGLMREEDGLAHTVLTEAGLTAELCWRRSPRRSVGAGFPGGNPAQGLTPRARAGGGDRGGGCRPGRLADAVGTEHLLAGILRDGSNMAVRILRTAGVRRPPALLRPDARSSTRLPGARAAKSAAKARGAERGRQDPAASSPGT